MEDIVMGSMAQRRLETGLASVFALIGLVLTATGVFGAVSHNVGMRRREMGIRLALGGVPSNIKSLIVRQAMMPVVIGLVVGLAAALMSARLVSGFLYGTSARDPAVFVGVAGVVGIAAFLGCYLPASHASTVDPSMTLRLE
jgi:ABC-type antimicrobial peptide transport system permease subunit